MPITPAQHRQYTQQATQALKAGLSGTITALTAIIDAELEDAYFDISWTPASQNEVAAMVVLLNDYSRLGWIVQVTQDNDTTITTPVTIRFAYANLVPEVNVIPGTVTVPAAWDQAYHTVLASYA